MLRSTPKAISCFSLLTLFVAVPGQPPAAQTIVNRIDTYHDGIFSLSDSGPTENIGAITSSSSDFFNTRTASVSTGNGGTGPITAELDYTVTPSVNIVAQDNDYSAFYSNEDGSTRDLTAGGANALLLRLEQFQTGEQLYISASNPSSSSAVPVTITTASEYVIPYSEFSFVNMTVAQSVGFGIIDRGSPAGTYVVEGFYTAIVPEPAGASILGPCALALVGRRRTRGRGQAVCC